MEAVGVDRAKLHEVMRYEKLPKITYIQRTVSFRLHSVSNGQRGF